MRDQTPGSPFLRIAVVTPIFPTSTEPYRGWPVYCTVVELQHFAPLDVLVPICLFPKWRLLHPKQMRYNRPDPAWQPSGIPARYLFYRSLPLIGRPFNGFSSLCAITPHLRRLKPQLILAYWLYPEGYAAVTAGRKLGIPVVVGARGSDLKLEDPLTRPMALRALRDSNGVIVVSEDMRRRALAFGAPPGNVHTVLNGVDRSIFHLQSRQAARAVLGIDAATRLVSFVGWLSRTKGLAELADAITELKRRGGNIQLVCIGEGPLAEELRLRSQPGGDLHNGVIMAGPLMGQAIARWLAASDLLCLPSHAEGLPNVVLEALACGRPVVASDVGGIPEIIRPDCGLLVPARDTARLAEAIHQALAAEWDENVIAGRWSRTWQDSAHETYRICQWAAGRANGPA